LYGIDYVAPVVTPGRLDATVVEIQHHKRGTKEIPSGFFAQPDGENVSAVLFTNQGTLGKFTRMAFLRGMSPPGLMVDRFGFAFDPDPEAIDPIAFAYRMTDPMFDESWSSGAWLFHNPSASRPLRVDMFKGDVNHMQIVNGRVYQAGSGDRVLLSKTFSWSGEQKGIPPGHVRTMPIRMADALGLQAPQGWTRDTVFVADHGKLIGVLIRQDATWSYRIHSLGGSVVDGEHFADRTSARVKVQMRILLTRPDGGHSLEREDAVQLGI
jgi:hypothetical protein